MVEKAYSCSEKMWRKITAGVWKIQPRGSKSCFAASGLAVQLSSV
jgi:hypothetical protein